MESTLSRKRLVDKKSGSQVFVTLPKRDRLIILFGIIAVFAVSWVYLLVQSNNMSNMDMQAMMGLRLRTATDLFLLFIMWAIMMVAMMLPSAIPMILLQAAVLKKTQNLRFYKLSIGMFIAGYVFVWTAFSIIATAVQALLEYWALLSPLMVTNSTKLGGLIFIAAGIYQVTPVKGACLEHCKTPIIFLTTHWKPGVSGALKMGLQHGVYCVGCCWAVMALLFVGGVMNLFWIAFIAIFVLLEKVSAIGAIKGRIVSAVCLFISGAWLLFVV